MNGTTHLADGTRVTTPDGPGSVVAHIDAETIAIRLDGETRIDCWHPALVKVEA